MSDSPRCDMCGGADPALHFAIRYAEYPPRKWAWRKNLLANEIGTVHVAICNRCRWAHFRGQQVVIGVLLVGFLSLLVYLDPKARELGWWLPLVFLLPIALLACFPIFSRALGELRVELFRKQKERLAVAHGTTADRPRPISNQ